MNEAQRQYNFVKLNELSEAVNNLFVNFNTQQKMDVTDVLEALDNCKELISDLTDYDCDYSHMEASS